VSEHPYPSVRGSGEELGRGLGHGDGVWALPFVQLSRDAGYLLHQHLLGLLDRPCSLANAWVFLMLSVCVMRIS
jgi:hypothetical protein